MSAALARALVAHIDQATPYRKRERTLAQRLQRAPCDWIESWPGLAALSAVVALVVFLEVTR